MMNSLGRISNRGLIAQGYLTRLQCTASSMTSDLSRSEIKIPIRKERGPTDILRALKVTIGRDPTAAHYQYHDDPYLLPHNNYGKRVFALAKASGRKAAKWIRENHSNLFQHRVADPIIEEFLPKLIYEKKDVNEEILKDAIMNSHVTDALNIYKLLEGNTTIEIKQSLFELLCFYNNSKPFSRESLEEKWIISSERSLPWRRCPDTEKLFQFLKNQDIEIAANAYNTMICGLSKYMEFKDAWSIYEEAKKKKIPLYLITYNYIIGVVPFCQSHSQEPQNLLLELLNTMKNSGIQPDITTLNNSLKVCDQLVSRYPKMKDFCLSLFSEFEYIGIKPSLASYFYALKIFYEKYTNENVLLKQIMNELDGQELEIRHSADQNFFVAAMKSSLISNDIELGDKVHKLLLTGKNSNFLSDGHRENIYYNSYILLHLRNQPFADFINSIYNILVPSIHIPEIELMTEILNTAAINDPTVSMQVLPELWSHLVQFNYLDFKDLVSLTMNIMMTHCKPPKNSPLNKMFSDAAWTLWEYKKRELTKQKKIFIWEGLALADVAILLLRGDEFEKFLQVISYLYDKQNTLVGVPNKDQIQELFETCVRLGFSDVVINLLEYCFNVGIGNVERMAVDLCHNLTLTEKQKNRLKSFVDTDIFQIPPE